MVFVAGSGASAQDLNQTITMSAQNSDVREVLRGLFKQCDCSYTIAPEVQGTVTFRVTNVSLEATLQNILRQVGATFTVANGVIEVRSEKTAPIAPPQKVSLELKNADIKDAIAALFKKSGRSYSLAAGVSGHVDVNLKDVSFDAALTYLLKAVRADYRIVKNVYQIAPANSFSHESQNTTNMDLENADVRETLRQLFKTVGVSYSVDPDVQGTVTLSLKNVTFEAALQNILHQVDATYSVEGGVYHISKVHRYGPLDH